MYVSLYSVKKKESKSEKEKEEKEENLYSLQKRDFKWTNLMIFWLFIL